MTTRLNFPHSRLWKHVSIQRKVAKRDGLIVAAVVKKQWRSIWKFRGKPVCKL